MTKHEFTTKLFLLQLSLEAATMKAANEIVESPASDFLKDYMEKHGIEAGKFSVKTFDDEEFEYAMRDSGIKYSDLAHHFADQMVIKAMQTIAEELANLIIDAKDFFDKDEEDETEVGNGNQ